MASRCSRLVRVGLQFAKPLPSVTEAPRSIFAVHSRSYCSDPDKTTLKTQNNADYGYFKDLSKLTSDVEIKAEVDEREKSIAVPDEYSELYAGLNIADVKPAIPKESFNLATYVNKSETLTNLVQLGVDLSKVEKHRADANHLLKLDFEKDIQPRLRFLYDVGVADSDIGDLLSKNPAILREDLDDLEVRVNYLDSKKFSKDAIARIVAKAPLFLAQGTKETDVQLGYLQREFRLTGDEVRTTITRYPKLTTWRREGIKQIKFQLAEYMGFTRDEMKNLLLSTPKIYTSDPRALTQRFDYLHNTMSLTHDQILHWPAVFRTRLSIISQRHQFLAHLGRAQYDGTKPLYVSLKALVSGRDSDFCHNVAKVPVKQFNDFLKTL